MTQNYFTYDVTDKKSATPNQKIFFECKLEDWPLRLSAWTALYHNQQRSMALVKQPKTAGF